MDPYSSPYRTTGNIVLAMFIAIPEKSAAISVTFLVVLSWA